MISPEDTTVYMIVNKMPLFGKSKADLMNYVLNNIQLPQDVVDDLEAKRKGVYAQFIVEKDGSLSNISISRSTHTTLTNAVYELLLKMPKWSPGRQNNLPVRVLYGLPIDFGKQQHTVITTTTVRSMYSGGPATRTSSTQTTITNAPAKKKLIKKPVKKPVSKVAPNKKLVH